MLCRWNGEGRSAPIARKFECKATSQHCLLVGDRHHTLCASVADSSARQEYDFSDGGWTRPLWLMIDLLLPLFT